MNINYKQPQFELFPANSATMEDVNKPRFLLANLTLSIESLVILAILGIMIALFAFSLGVERGKHLAAQSLDERVSAAWNLAPRKPTMPAKPVAAKTAATVAKTAAVTTTAAVAVQPKAMVKTTVKAAAKTAPVAAAATNRFTLQIGSYKSEAFAKQEALALKAKGLTPSFLIKKGDFWLVCLGQYTSPEAANSVLKKMPPKYRGSSVRRF